MRWSHANPRPDRSRPRTSASRRARPTLEGLEGRELMASGMLSNLGGMGIASEVVTHGPTGQQEAFVRLVSNNAIFQYSYATGQFTFTGGYLDRIAAADGGIVGLGGGGLFSYQDGKGYSYLGGNALGSLVVAHNASGSQEVFARATNSGEIFEYNFANNQFSDTHGQLDQFAADDTGITGTVNGYLFHYQDGFNYTYTGGSGISSFVVTHNPQGQDVAFVRLASNGSIYTYNYASHSFANTGGQLDQLVANNVGVSGTLNGYLFFYSFTGGFYFTGASNVSGLVDSHDPLGREELFVRSGNGTVWDYVYSSHEWHTPGFGLDQFVADDTGITGTLNGVLFHYQDGTTDLAGVGADYALHNGYSGTFSDNYTFNSSQPPLVMSGSTTGSIALTLTAALPGPLGYDVMGFIRVTDTSGHLSFYEPFQGVYTPANPYFSGYPASFVIQNFAAYGPGSAPKDGVAFRFSFNIVPSTGYLLLSDSSGYPFSLLVTTPNSTASTTGGGSATLMPTT